jgi:glycerate-2-kinase
MAVPADGVSLEDKRRTTEQLLRAGADIQALNTVRKHLSAIKGGWLANRAAGPVRTFVISDVVGDDPSVIASGPTVPDASTFADARQLLDRYGGTAAYPEAVVARLIAALVGQCQRRRSRFIRLVKSDIRVMARGVTRCWVFMVVPSGSAMKCCASTMPWSARRGPPRPRTCGRCLPLPRTGHVPCA